MYTFVSGLTFGGPPLQFGKKKKSYNLTKYLFWRFDCGCLNIYPSCEEGFADWRLLALARLARVLDGALCRASQRTVTRMRARARTERTKAAIPISHVTRRRGNTPNRVKSASMSHSLCLTLLP